MNNTQQKYPICLRSKISNVAILIASDKKAIVVEFDKNYKNIRCINDVNFVATQLYCFKDRMYREINLETFKRLYLKVKDKSEKYIPGVIHITKFINCTIHNP